ncbi:MAG: sugar phosphate nucleotidyltransferase [Melioribacteraceae bacterium]
MKSKTIIVLAGGISSRMKNPTHVNLSVDDKLLEDANKKSKAMIGVGNGYRPFLDYLLFNVKKSGYQNVIIVIGEKDNSIKQYYGSNVVNDFLGLKITYATQFIPSNRTKPLGTADALFSAVKVSDRLKDDEFTVCNSDNLYSVDALTLMLNTKYKNAMINYDRDGFEFENERVERFAITKIDGEGFLLDIIEKPSAELIDEVIDQYGFVGVSMNIFKLNYNMIYSFLENVEFHRERNEKELPTAIKNMIDKFPQSLKTFKMKEHVPDLTSKKDIIPVKKYLLKEFAKSNFENE